MLSELHSLNLKLCIKEYNKIDLVYLIVAPQLSSGLRHNFLTKTRLMGSANEQSMYSFMSMVSYCCSLSAKSIIVNQIWNLKAYLHVQFQGAILH